MTAPLTGRRTGSGSEAPPAFLVGPARSGTSMLYKLLCLHPDSAYVSNYVRRVPMLPELAGLNRIARRAPQMRQRSWFGDDHNAYVYGSPRSFWQWALPAPVEGEPLFRRCGFVEYEHEHPAPPQEQARRLHAAVRRIKRAGAGSAFINKRIANNRRIPQLHAAFPQARFVSLVRDGRAVALSLSKVDWWEDGIVWFTGGTPRQWAEQGGDPLELCARNWVEELNAIDDGLADVPPEQVLSVRYEDFITSPRSELARIGEFIGLAPSPQWEQELDRASFPDKNESWRRSLDAATLSMIESVQGERLRELHYLV